METISDRLKMLAALWNELTGGRGKPHFDAQFLVALENIHRFQKEFPDKQPTPLLKILELKVLHILNREFPECGGRKAFQHQEQLTWIRVLSGSKSKETA